MRLIAALLLLPHRCFSIGSVSVDFLSSHATARQGFPAARVTVVAGEWAAVVVAELIPTFFGTLLILDHGPDRNAAETYVGGSGAHVVQPQAILEHTQQGVCLDFIGEGEGVGFIIPIMRQRQRCFGVACAKLESAGGEVLSHLRRLGAQRRGSMQARWRCSEA